jgi:hypothetical protein
MIRGGKLMQPQFDDIRPKLEFRWRMFVVAFALAFTYFVALPFSRDLAYIASGKKPVEITATVQYRSVPLFGMWFVNQSVRLARKKSIIS